MEHAVIHAMYAGEWPRGIVDHKNTKRTDNAPSNLRDVSRSVNQQNLRAARTDSKTGVLGVVQIGSRFAASIRIDGKQTRIGTFGTAGEAGAAYVDAKRANHEGCTL